MAAQIPEQSLPLGQGEPLALAGTGEKADERPFRVVLPERQQPWAGAVQQAAELNLIGEMTVHAEQLQRLVGVVAVIVGSEGLGEQGIPLGIVKAQLLAGFYPAGDEVIGAGGKGHIDPIVMLTAQSPQHRQGGQQPLALQPDRVNALQLQIGQEGEQLAADAHQLYLGMGVGTAYLLQEGQQKQVVADAAGAANDQDPLGRLAGCRQSALTREPGEGGPLQPGGPAATLTVEAAQGISDSAHK